MPAAVGAPTGQISEQRGGLGEQDPPLLAAGLDAEELLNGSALDQLVRCWLHPTRVALGFRLLARNPAIGLQTANARPFFIREPAAFRAAHVDGLGTLIPDRQTLLLTLPNATPDQIYHLPWAHRTVRLVA